MCAVEILCGRPEQRMAIRLCVMGPYVICAVRQSVFSEIICLHHSCIQKYMLKNKYH